LGVPEALAVFATAVVLALLGVELRQRILLVLGKPVATLSLLGVVWSGPSTMTEGLVGVGLLLSTVGDAALLVKGARAFMVGLGTFLVAHLLYAVAFLVTAGPSTLSPLVGIIVFGTGSGWLVRRMWAGLNPALRPPLVFYTAACTAMAAAALATLTGDWPPEASAAVAIGGTLFFVSDANLAWNDFVQPYRHGQTVTLSLYWAGQLGIALGARWASGA
jgi:uncharacterized membrane protein YhhN